MPIFWYIDLLFQLFFALCYYDCVRMMAVNRARIAVKFRVVEVKEISVNW